MSPESEKKLNETIDDKNKSENDKIENNEMSVQSSLRNEDIDEQQGLDISSRKRRERCIQSPPPKLLEPLSPCPSSDVTFEPTIDMIVNDFDDEQTLNEEEALAALEQDSQDEISTLKEESEMPIDELLAKYQFVSIPIKKEAKIIRTKKDTITSANNCLQTEKGKDITIIDGGDDDANIDQNTLSKDNNVDVAKNVSPQKDSIDEQEVMETVMDERIKPQRSHLLDLYLDQNFPTVPGTDDKSNSFELHYGDDDDGEDEEETENDYVKKTIMVGPAYQACIPDGLSQYGDILPYENEDKLVWEPSQVSEREVECYLEYFLKARDVKSGASDDDSIEQKMIDDINEDNHIKGETSIPNTNTMTKSTPLTGDEPGSVVKDNEQALHLLVQCGYDFKEALRRKRLNALPLTGSMSLWSEEECQKFEEGIQKYGKDFLKIRQNQVRTRTMREIVQFYYLWKKSERRDHDFANSDTVDHMDIYLNDFGPNSASTSNYLISSNTSQGTGGFMPKNFSIMSNSCASLQLQCGKSVSNKKNVANNTSATLLSNPVASPK